MQRYGTPHKDVCLFLRHVKSNAHLLCCIVRDCNIIAHCPLPYGAWQCHTCIDLCCRVMTSGFTVCLETACTHALRTESFAMSCKWLKCNAGSTRTRYLESAHQRSSDVRRTQQMTLDWTRSCTLPARSLPVTPAPPLPPAHALCCTRSLALMTCASQQPAACFKLVLKRSYNDQDR